MMNKTYQTNIFSISKCR